MSFSGDVRKELIGIIPKQAGEARAELCGIAAAAGSAAEDGSCLIHSDSEELQRKFFTLFRKTFNIRNCETKMLSEGRRRFFTVDAEGGAANMVREAEAAFLAKRSEREMKAFLRGAFLAGGSLSNPKRYYHFEIVGSSEDAAKRVMDVMKEFSLPVRLTERKGSYVVYMKEADSISFALGLMGANLAVLEMENVRIYREIRGQVNRQVNCEAANLMRSIRMSVRQCEDCEYLREKGALGTLKRNLRETAELRLAEPNATLEELGKKLDPPIGKSGVNHRLMKLHEIAESLRRQEENIQAESL